MPIFKGFKKMGRKRTRLTEKELETAKKILSFGASSPPFCVCGERDYGFEIFRGTLRAVCLECGYIRTYKVFSRKWSPIFFKFPKEI